MSTPLGKGGYGRRGCRVSLRIEAGRIEARWRVAGERKQRSWPDTAAHRREAIAWAEAFARAREERQQPVDLLSVAKLWERFCEAEFPQLRPRTIAFYQDSWKFWALFVGHERIAEDLGMQTVTSFRAHLEGDRGLGINSTRRIIQTVKTVYAWGYRQRLLTRNELRDFRFKVAKEKRPASPGEYRREELEAILRELPLDRATTWRAHGVLALCGFQGARVNAVLHLRWDDVDLGTGTLIWRARWDKLGREETQPIRPAARAVLERLRSWTEGPGWLFPPALRTSRLETFSVQSVWAALMGAEKRAGVAHKGYRAMHGLRRLLFNEVLQETGDLALAMAAIRDVDLKVASGYHVRRDDRLRAAFEAMDRKVNPNVNAGKTVEANPVISLAGAAGFEPATSGINESLNPGQPAVTALHPAAPEPSNTPQAYPETPPEKSTERQRADEAPGAAAPDL